MTRKKRNKPRKQDKFKKAFVCYDGATDKGLVRQNNEDAFIVEKIWNDSTVLAVVIDGLGGYEGGEVAASIAKERIRNYLVNSQNGTFIEMLKQAVTSANNAIFETACADSKYYGMGCVLTAAIIDIKSRQVSMVHVGDTRMYGFHMCKLEKLSHDHSQVGLLEESGNLTEEEAMIHPNRNVVDRVLGHQLHLSSDNDFIESHVFELIPNTTFLLCSDGLTDMVSSRTIVGILSCKCKLKDKTNALIQASLDAGGKDNVTVLLVDYLDDEDESAALSKNHQNQELIEKDVFHNTDKPDVENKRHVVSLNYVIVLTIIGFFIGLVMGFEIAMNRKVQKNMGVDNAEKATLLNNVENTSTNTYIIVSDTINNN